MSTPALSRVLSPARPLEHVADVPPGASSLEALRTAVDAMEQHVTLLAPDGRVVHVNRARRAAADPAAVHDPDPLRTAEAGDAQARSIAAGIRGVLSGASERFELEYARRDRGAVRRFALRASAIGVDGVGAVVVHTDVTARHRVQQELEHRLDHDGLTGLGNRRLLEQRLEELLLDGQVGVIALRLHGPDRDAVRITGGVEEALRETAELVEQLVDERAVCGRHGADHFVVLLPRADHAEARRTAIPLAAGWQARLRRRGDLHASVATAVVHPGEDARTALERATRGEAHGPAGAPV